MPSSTSDPRERSVPDALTHLPLIGHVVHQLAARYPRNVDRTAMWNAGAAGLLYALRHAETPGMLFSQHLECQPSELLRRGSSRVIPGLLTLGN